jgi:hypothetical protein
MAYGLALFRFVIGTDSSLLEVGLRRRVAPGSMLAYRTFKQPRQLGIARHCERSEAIHGTSARKLDCFAALATTGFATAGRYARRAGLTSLRQVRLAQAFKAEFIAQCCCREQSDEGGLQHQ